MDAFSGLSACFIPVSSACSVPFFFFYLGGQTHIMERTSRRQMALEKQKRLRDAAFKTGYTINTLGEGKASRAESHIRYGSVSRGLVWSRDCSGVERFSCCCCCYCCCCPLISRLLNLHKTTCCPCLNCVCFVLGCVPRVSALPKAVGLFLAEVTCGGGSIDPLSILDLFPSATGQRVHPRSICNIPETQVFVGGGGEGCY